MKEIEDIERIIGFTVHDFLSDRGLEKVIEDHKIKKEEIEEYILIKNLVNNGEKVALYYLQSKNPHNLILNSLCDTLRYPIRSNEENKDFDRMFKEFEQMYEVPKLTNSFNQNLNNFKLQCQAGKISITDFLHTMQSFSGDMEYLCNEALRNFEIEYSEIFRTSDIEIIEKENNEDEEEVEEDEDEL